MTEKFQTVKGMQDYMPERMRKKQYIEDLCRGVFERYGFAPLQTPAVEYFDLLAAKGSAGEAIKEELYYFKDKSDRELGLRFDLTVPLARIVASSPQLLNPLFRRYQIGTAYRYDKPTTSRYREFTQADVDIGGVRGIAGELEILQITVDIFSKLGVEFYIKINNRRLLEEIALACGIQKAQINDAFRSIDKLDKIGWEGVEKELVEKKINARIVELVKKNDLDEIGKLLRKGNADLSVLEEMKKLLALLGKLGIGKYAKLDLSLARGLEYYTGTVYEVICLGKWSCAAGGRFDRLIENYGGAPTPAVGISFGIDRILDVAEEKIKLPELTKVFVINVGDDEKIVLAAMEVAQKLRALGINTRMNLVAGRLGKVLSTANKLNVPFAVIIGEDELKNKEITLRDMRTGKQQNIKLGELEKIVKIVE